MNHAAMQFPTTCEEWLRLPLGKTKNVPHLFYNFATTTTGFRLLITDLVSLWSCTLERNEIIEEARNQQCSIDPSESSAQFKTLISKFHKSLRDGENALANSRTKGERNFELQTSIDLPAPLRPFRWTFFLDGLDPFDLAEHIILPTLIELSESTQKLESLFQVIKDKDHVIAKLLDKIEGSAIDLSHIFPGITGLKSKKNHMSVSEASKYVPGMATFDKSVWGSDNSDKQRNSYGVSSLSKSLNQLVAANTLNLPSREWTARLPFVDDLAEWNNSKDLSGKAKRSHTIEAAQMRETSGSSSDAGFEVGSLVTPVQSPTNLRQSSYPPKLIITEPRHNIEHDDGDISTESESGESYQRLAKSVKRGKISAIGGGKETTNEKALSADLEEVIQTTARPKPDPSAATHSDSSSNSDSPEPNPKVRPKPASKLGILGGRKKPTPIKSPSPRPQHTLSNTSTTTQRLGVIGGEAKTPPKAHKISPTNQTPSKYHAEPSENKAEDNDSDATPSPTPSPSPVLVAPSAPNTTRKSPSPSPASDADADTTQRARTEIVQETAASRRQELKRTLNSTVTAKKKRKF
jgi:XLF-Cernunnos, XRcc4-like factor, NHEJ component